MGICKMVKFSFSTSAFTENISHSYCVWDEVFPETSVKIHSYLEIYIQHCCDSEFLLKYMKFVPILIFSCLHQVELLKIKSSKPAFF